MLSADIYYCRNSREDFCSKLCPFAIVEVRESNDTFLLIKNDCL
jgi:hypothetical protein